VGWGLVVGITVTVHAWKAAGLVVPATASGQRQLHKPFCSRHCCGARAMPHWQSTGRPKGCACQSGLTSVRVCQQCVFEELQCIWCELVIMVQLNQQLTD